MANLKILSSGAIPRALKRAKEYRLLNRPDMAESICLDVLRTAPDNQKALRLLLLARTDQFGANTTALAASAREIQRKLKNEYDRAYYEGIILERTAEAQLEHQPTTSGRSAYELLTRAMAFYEDAERLSSKDNDDSIVRWNACVRTMQKIPNSGPRETQEFQTMVGE